MDDNTTNHAADEDAIRMNWILRATGRFVERRFSPPTYELYKRINKQHPKISTTGITMLYILFFVILFKLAYTPLKYYHLFPKVEEIEHIDMAALLCAVLSIVIAFLITIYVEEIRREQTESLALGSLSIKDVTDKIEKVTNQMWGILAAFDAKKSLFQRLNAIESIINMTWESQQNTDRSLWNRMYILNYNASYGHLQSFNASLTLGDEDHKHQMPRTWIEYHKIFNYYNERQSQVFNKLLDLDKNSINIGLLRTKVDNFKNQEDKYERLLNKVLVENTEQKAYGYFECDTKTFDIMKNNYGKDDIYTLPLSFSDNQKNEAIVNKEEQKKIVKEKLIEEFCLYNKGRIEALKAADVIEKIAYLDYVPFQFYLTVPRDMNKSSKQKCLVIFTNTLHPTHTVSFVSDNEALMQTLIDIHTTLTDNYETKETEKQKLMALFSCADSEPTFVLTKVIDKAGNEKTDMAYLSDYDACTDLKELFLHHQIVNPTIQLNDVLNFKEIEKQKKTFVVIGLFGNTISETLRFTKGENKSCFTFSRIRKKGRGKHIEYTDEIIRIKDDTSNIIIDGIKWKEFPREEGKELALLAKVRVGGSTVIICGGLSGYGTGIIGRYIRGNIAFIADKIGVENLKTESFAIIFSMPWLDKNGNEYDSRVIKEIEIVGVFT